MTKEENKGQKIFYFAAIPSKSKVIIRKRSKEQFLFKRQRKYVSI